MKRNLTLLAGAALVVFSFAAPANVRDRSDGQKLPLDATLDDGFPSTSNQHPDDDMLQAAALGVNTSASLLMRDGNTLEKRLNPITMPPTVRVVMGNDPAGKSLKDFRQHVGLKFGDELRKDIKTGLSALCPWGQTSCPTDGVDPWKIEPIYYTTKNHELASNAHLNLRIIKSSFPEGYFGLREILIDAVAGAYGAISATDQNCYDAWATGEKKHMCNVVDFVGVEIAHWYGRADELQDPGASLFVTLTSSGATKKGKFDCIGSQTPVHNFLDSDKTGDKIADILGAARTSMGRRVDCPHTGVIERGIIPAPVTSLEKRTTNTVHLGIGNEKSHIGVLVGQNLGAAIRHGLDILCPPGQGGFDTCHKDPYLGMTDIARIGHDHGATDNKYSDDASMKMWVTTSYWPADRYEGMREALIQVVSLAFQAYTDNEKNCYDVTLHEKGDGMYRRFQFCNIGEIVLAHVNDIAWLMVKIYFNGKSDDGSLDCEATKVDVFNHLDYDPGARKKIAGILQIPMEELGSTISCET